MLVYTHTYIDETDAMRRLTSVSRRSMYVYNTLHIALQTNTIWTSNELTVVGQTLLPANNTDRKPFLALPCC